MPQLIIKEGVDLSGLRPEITASIWPTAQVFFDRGYDAIITDAMRPPGSGLHPLGLALDWRGKHLEPGLYWSVFGEIKAALGGNEPFDFQTYPGTTWHYHIEYDPKR